MSVTHARGDHTWTVLRSLHSYLVLSFGLTTHRWYPSLIRSAGWSTELQDPTGLDAPTC